MKILILVLVSLNLLAYHPAIQFDYPKPTKITYTGKWWATIYDLPTFQYSTSNKYPLLNLNNKKLGPTLSKKDWCKGALEGSLRIRKPHFVKEQQVCEKENSLIFIHSSKSANDYLVFNYSGRGSYKQVDCSEYFNVPGTGFVRFATVKGFYGTGVEGDLLVPYRSIASKFENISVGDVVYIPEARGLKIKVSSGREFIHDGYFYIADTGGVLRDDQFDMYVGPNNGEEFLNSFAQSTPDYQFKVYKVKDSKILKDLKEIHTRLELMTGDEF